MLGARAPALDARRATPSARRGRRARTRSLITPPSLVEVLRAGWARSCRSCTRPPGAGYRCPSTTREGLDASNAQFHTALPATDLDRARGFYAEKLGLHPAEESPAGLFYNGAGGTRFLLYPTQGAASGTHTQMGYRRR